MVVAAAADRLRAPSSGPTWRTSCSQTIGSGSALGLSAMPKLRRLHVGYNEIAGTSSGGFAGGVALEELASQTRLSRTIPTEPVRRRCCSMYSSTAPASAGRPRSSARSATSRALARVQLPLRTLPLALGGNCSRANDYTPSTARPPELREGTTITSRSATNGWSARRAASVDRGGRQTPLTDDALPRQPQAGRAATSPPT